MRLIQCDQCRRETSGVLDPRDPEDSPALHWVVLHRHECRPDSPCEPACRPIELCSWGCAADYCAARNVVQGELGL